MNVHLIIGGDDYLVGETAKKFVGDGLGLEVIDSMEATNAELQLADLRRADESLSTPPFLDPQKVTWWKNVHFLPGGNVSEEVKEALERFAEKLAAMDLPDNQQFILSGPHLLKSSVFAKRLAASAEIIVFAAEKPWEVERNAVVRAVDVAKEMGLSFAPGVAEKFVSIVGPDMRSLVSEIGKLRDYLGPETAIARAEDVTEVTSAGAKVEAEIWDVTDAIGKRDLASALTALKKFESESGFAVFLSGVIEKFFRQLIEVKAGRTAGMNPYVARKNASFAANWTLAELEQARARFLDLREKAVSGTNAGEVLVVTTLVRVMRRAARRN